VVVVLLGLGAFFVLGGDEDDDDTASGSTTAPPAPTTTTTEPDEGLSLAEWVEEGDDVCSDVNDELANLPVTNIEEAAEALPEVIGILEDQSADLEDLGLPADEPDVDDFMDLLAEQIAFLEEMNAAIEDGGDPDEVFDDATESGDELSEEMSDLAQEMGFEHCGQEGEDGPTPTTDGTPPTSGGGDGEPFTYGDDPELDALWDACAEGSAEACDDLWAQSPVDSEYEDFGYSCGGVVPEGETEICSDVLGEDPPSGDGEAFTFGDDPQLDALWTACSDGDAEACDDLFWDSPIDSEYETFGDTCGYRFPEEDAPGSCVGAM
jgi:hypothetical protein